MTAIPPIEWEEGKDWGPAVRAATVPDLFPYWLAGVPALGLASFFVLPGWERAAGVGVCVLGTTGLLAWGYRTWTSERYQTARGLYAEASSSAAYKRAWDGIGRALVHLGWCADEEKVSRVPTDKTDEHGAPILEERRETVRVYPCVYLIAGVPDGGLTIRFDTTSGTPVKASEIEDRASDLAALLGFGNLAVRVVRGASHVDVALSPGGDIYERFGRP